MPVQPSEQVTVLRNQVEIAVALQASAILRAVGIQLAGHVAVGPAEAQAVVQCLPAAIELPLGAQGIAGDHVPPLAMRLLESLSQRLYRHVHAVDWLTSSSASQRLAVYPLNLHRLQGAAIGLPINQRQLPGHLGVCAES